MNTLRLQQLTKCFNYRRKNLSSINVIGEQVKIVPGAPWDIEWCIIDSTQGKFTLSLLWKGNRNNSYTWTDLTFAKVIKIIKFYRG